VLPLDDRTALEILTIQHPSEEPTRSRYVYFREPPPFPKHRRRMFAAVTYKIVADVDVPPQRHQG
jgi:arylsulfatase